MTQPGGDDPNISLTDTQPLTFTGPNGMQYSMFQDGTFTDQNGNAIPYEQGMDMVRNADLDNE